MTWQFLIIFLFSAYADGSVECSHFVSSRTYNNNFSLKTLRKDLSRTQRIYLTPVQRQAFELYGEIVQGLKFTPQEVAQYRKSTGETAPIVYRGLAEIYNNNPLIVIKGRSSQLTSNLIKQAWSSPQVLDHLRELRDFTRNLPGERVYPIIERLVDLSRGKFTQEEVLRDRIWRAFSGYAVKGKIKVPDSFEIGKTLRDLTEDPEILVLSPLQIFSPKEPEISIVPHGELKYWHSQMGLFASFPVTIAGGPKYRALKLREVTPQSVFGDYIKIIVRGTLVVSGKYSLDGLDGNLFLSMIIERPSSYIDNQLHNFKISVREETFIGPEDMTTLGRKLNRPVELSELD